MFFFKPLRNIYESKIGPIKMLNYYIFCLAAIAVILGSATAATTSNGAAGAAAVSDNLDEYTTVAVLPSALAATLAAAPATTTPQNGAIAAPSVPVPQAAPQLPNVGVLAYDRVGISDGVEFSPSEWLDAYIYNYKKICKITCLCVCVCECGEELSACAYVCACAMQWLKELFRQIYYTCHFFFPIRF